MHCTFYYSVYRDILNMCNLFLPNQLFPHCNCIRHSVYIHSTGFPCSGHQTKPTNSSPFPPKKLHSCSGFFKTPKHLLEVPILNPLGQHPEEGQLLLAPKPRENNGSHFGPKGVPFGQRLPPRFRVGKGLMDSQDFYDLLWSISSRSVFACYK